MDAGLEGGRDMKVLDLQCAQSHTFEGWFASELDFVSQGERGLLLCPVCGDATVHKMLSAPRLNLGSGREIESLSSEVIPVATPTDAALTTAWMSIAKLIVANTSNVGSQFAEEARKMHYGETPERAIRGTTSAREAEALLDEGIGVIPLYLPESLKEPLQ
jgi:hypothetical protein